jgi:hypothetical protein
MDVENKIEVSKDKFLILDSLFLNKKDLLRALSWFDFVALNDIQSEDKVAKDNILKLVNYLTRNA